MVFCLQETIPDLLSNEGTDRVTPRLERKKVNNLTHEPH